MNTKDLPKPARRLLKNETFWADLTPELASLAIEALHVESLNRIGQSIDRIEKQLQSLSSVLTPSSGADPGKRLPCHCNVVRDSPPVVVPRNYYINGMAIKDLIAFANRQTS